LVGKILDKRYVVLEEISPDGDSVRYAAYDMNTMARVQIKVMPDEEGQLSGKKFELLDGPPPEPVKKSTGGAAKAGALSPRAQKTGSHDVKELASSAEPPLKRTPTSSGAGAVAAGGAAKDAAKKSTEPPKWVTAKTGPALPGSGPAAVEGRKTGSASHNLSALKRSPTGSGLSTVGKPAAASEALQASAPPKWRNVKTSPFGTAVPPRAAEAAPPMKEVLVPPPAPSPPPVAAPRLDRPDPSVIPLTAAKTSPLLQPPPFAPAHAPQPPAAIAPTTAAPGGKNDPAQTTQQFDLAAAEEVKPLLISPSVTSPSRKKVETRKIEAAWFAQGDLMEESKPNDPLEVAQPGLTQDELEMQARQLSPDDYRKYALDLSPPSPPPVPSSASGTIYGMGAVAPPAPQGAPARSPQTHSALLPMTGPSVIPAPLAPIAPLPSPAPPPALAAVPAPLPMTGPAPIPAPVFAEPPVAVQAMGNLPGPHLAPPPSHPAILHNLQNQQNLQNLHNLHNLHNMQNLQNLHAPVAAPPPFAPAPFPGPASPAPLRVVEPVPPAPAISLAAAPPPIAQVPTGPGLPASLTGTRLGMAPAPALSPSLAPVLPHTVAPGVPFAPAGFGRPPAPAAPHIAPVAAMEAPRLDAKVAPAAPPPRPPLAPPPASAASFPETTASPSASLPALLEPEAGRLDPRAFLLGTRLGTFLLGALLGVLLGWGVTCAVASRRAPDAVPARPVAAAACPACPAPEKPLPAAPTPVPTKAEPAPVAQQDSALPAAPNGEEKPAAPEPAPEAKKEVVPEPEPEVEPVAPVAKKTPAKKAATKKGAKHKPSADDILAAGSKRGAKGKKAKVPAKDPKQAASYAASATRAAQTGQWDLAYRLAVKALALQPDNKEASRVKAQAEGHLR
jgi:hypothetical protein